MLRGKLPVAFAFVFQFHGDAIHRVEEGLDAGFDAVGGDAAAAIDLALVLGVARCWDRG